LKDVERAREWTQEQLMIQEVDVRRERGGSDLWPSEVEVEIERERERADEERGSERDGERDKETV
jgi:hypothetical protein